MRFTNQLFYLLQNIGRFLSSETKASYYTQAMLSILIGFLLSNLSQFPLIKLLVVGAGFWGSFYFYILAQNVTADLSVRSEEHDNLFEAAVEDTPKEEVFDSRTIINTSGGNYNERIDGNYIHENYVEGDFIEIQGHYININQDVSEVVQQLRQIQIQLQQQGINSERIESYILNDLKKELHDNAKFRNILFHWSGKAGSSYPRSQIDELKAAETLIEYAFSFPKNLLSDAVTTVEDDYQLLHELLQENKWHEADLETARLIFELSHKNFELPDNRYLWLYDSDDYILCARDIEMLPGKDLNLINALWVKSSNGHFGFSIQKRLLHQLCGANTYNYLDDYMEEFGNLIGWRMDDDWIYYSDLSYLSSVPVGHLPAIVMMPRSYSGYTTCEPDEALFNVFMRRAYTV